MSRIAVTDLEFDKARTFFENAAGQGWQCLRAPTAETELAAFIRNERIRHAIIGTTTYRGPLYESLAPGAVVVRFGVGHDGVEKNLATTRGILCANTPGTLDDSVAEHAMALVLAAMRHIPTLNAATRAGDWNPLMLHELAGKRLAIIGCGPIGRRLARLAGMGFDMEVVGCKAHDNGRRELIEKHGFVRVETDFARAVADADFVSLHLPSTPATRHFIDSRRLAAIPRGAWLVNTARGAVVDEAALYDALFNERLAGAALDVFEHEPYQPVHPERDLRALPNVIMTPHVGSATHEACLRVARRAIENIAHAEKNEFAYMDLLNPQVVERLG